MLGPSGNELVDLEVSVWRVENMVLYVPGVMNFKDRRFFHNFLMSHGFSRATFQPTKLVAIDSHLSFEKRILVPVPKTESHT